jgi:photosystem II stability/assembly factor-like uncharacterized protein
MKKLSNSIIIAIIFLCCISAACSPDDEIVTTTSNPSSVAFTFPLSKTLTAIPPTPVVPTPTRQTRPISQPDIPHIVTTIKASEQGEIVAGLAEPNTNRLYALDEAGLLSIFNLDDLTRFKLIDTGLDRNNSYGFYFGQMALDMGRDRLYVSGDPIQILDTNTFQLTSEANLRGYITPDPTTDRLYLTPPCTCRLEQCNTFILNANTLTGTQTLFPPQNPLSAPCVVATRLDAENQLLYTHINNGVPGSNSGFYFSFFDVSGPPERIYTENNISFGTATFDPARQRVFVPRWRLELSAIDRYDYQNQVVTSTQPLVGLRGELAYDPTADRLYVTQDTNLFTLDGNLTLFSEVPLPDRFNLLTIDPQGQHLYLGGPNGTILVIATSGGRLQPPPPEPDNIAQAAPLQRLVAPDGTHFRIFGERLSRSDDNGNTWQILGWGLPAHPVSTVTISPNYRQDQMLLAGLRWLESGGGLYRSTDGGDTWHPTTRGLTDLAVTAITFSPTFTQDQTVFATTQTQGLFRSTDGGDSWIGLAANYAELPSEARVSHLALSPTFAEDNLLIISSGTLRRSADGGNTWTDTHIPGGVVAFSPTFAEDGLVLSAGRWRSTDGGQTWQAAAGGLATTSFGAKSLHFSPDFATDQTAYLLLDRGYDVPSSLHRSVDAGRSWQMLLSGLPPGFEIALVTPLPGGRLILTARTGEEVTIAADTLDWGPPPADVNSLDLQALAVAPDGTLFVGSSTAGVFKSTNGGHTWTETNFPARGNAVEQIYLAIAEDDTLFAAVGPVIARTLDAGGHWTQMNNLPGGFEITSLAVPPDFVTDGIVIAGGSYARNDLIRSADGGETWDIVFEGSKFEEGSDIVALTFSPNFARDGVVYAWLQNSGLLRSTDGGLTWNLLTTDDSRFYAVQALAVAPDGRHLYLGALDGRFLVSADKGQSWLNLGNNIPDQRIWSSAIAFDSNSNIFLGTDVGIYRTLDSGQTWARASAGLPMRPESGQPQGIRSLQFDFDHKRLYAALTRGGLYISDDGGQSWHSTHVDLLLPSSTPAPTPTSSVEPTNCSTPPTYFTDIWADRITQLGCPIAGSSQSDLLMAEQSFAGGLMLWRSDTAEIYALPFDQPYIRLPDTWKASQPEYTCPEEAPSQTPPTPKRGFGKIWCQQPQLRQQLGNATAEEQLVEVTLQEFESGLIFSLDGIVYILEDQSERWEQVE